MEARRGGDEGGGGEVSVSGVVGEDRAKVLLAGYAVGGADAAVEIGVGFLDLMNPSGKAEEESRMR